MPTETFIRLPDEKRNRFLDAAWAEFTRVPFAATSINRIVRAAGIPRGSFYQYFSDKEDLFSFLLDGIKAHLGTAYIQLIQSQGGDLFKTQMTAFDLALQDGSRDPFMNRCIGLLRINPGIDLQRLLKSPDGNGLLAKLSAELDISSFPQKDPEVIQQAFFLSLMALGSAVVDSIIRPENSVFYRRELEIRMQIIQSGCLSLSADTAKEGL